jgi:hypothetical protein
VEITLTALNIAFAYLIQHGHQESALIEGAPVLVLTLFAISMTIGWVTSRLVYRSKIGGLREHIGVLEARVSFLADKLKYSERKRKRR